MISRQACFPVLVTAAVVSSVGTGLTTFTLSVEAFRRTGDATAVGIMQAAGMLPLILVTPLGGLLADRWDRRLTMLLGDGGSAVGLGFVVWLLSRPDCPPSQIAAALAVSSLFAGLTEPALRATVSDLVPPDRLDKAPGCWAWREPPGGWSRRPWRVRCCCGCGRGPSCCSTWPPSPAR